MAMEVDLSRSLHRFRVRRPASPDGSDPSTPRPRGLPACDRCRRFKKKCSRTLPVCALCASAGHKCSFSVPATGTAAQAQQLRARVEWLEKLIADRVPGGLDSLQSADGEAVHLGLTFEQSLTPTRQILQDGSSPGSGADTNTNTNTGSASIPLHAPAALVSDDGSADSSSGPTPLGLPPDAAARRFVDAYFRNVNRAYPFVDRNKVWESLGGFDDLARRRRTSNSTLLYLVMAIGCTTLQRAGQIPSDTISKFDISYPEIIQEFVCKDKIESVQVLLLLTLYSLFDPGAPSAFTIMGLVSRQAMALGLTRRATEDKGMSAADIELRHRLIWSIYVMDRMMSVSVGLPPALLDANMNAPLPGLTVDEFAAPERAQSTVALQMSRHVVQLRQLEGRIMHEVHFKKQSEIVMLSHPDRRIMMQQIRNEIENWYSNGCLVSPLESDNVPIHNSMTWLSARYYYLHLMLNYPCQFNPVGLLVPRVELLRYAQKHLQATAALFHSRQLPLNSVTLYRLLPVAMVLMHIFISSPADCLVFPVEAITIVQVLEAFPEQWIVAHRAQGILQQFLTSVNTISSYGSMQFSQYSFMSPISAPKETYQNLVRPHAAAFFELMQEVLGRASCWINDLLDGKAEACDPPNGGFPYQEQQGMPQIHVGANVMTGLGPSDAASNYGWGLELDFL